MKTLSIKPPFAQAVLFGGKDVENRTWKPKHRGKFLIHASARSEPSFAGIESYYTDEYLNTIDPDKIDVKYREIVDFNTATLRVNLVKSAIIGSVELVEVQQNSKSPWAIEGENHLILQKPVVFTRPILDVKGTLRFWDYYNPVTIHFAGMKIICNKTILAHHVTVIPFKNGSKLKMACDDKGKGATIHNWKAIEVFDGKGQDITNRIGNLDIVVTE